MRINEVLVILSAAFLLGLLCARSCQAFTVWKITTTTHHHPSSALFHARRRRIPNANELRQLQQEQAEEKQQTQEQQTLLEDTVGNSSVEQTTKLESAPNGKTTQQEDEVDTTSTSASTDSMMPKAMTSEEEDEEAAEETSSSTTDLAAAALLASAVAGAGLVATEVGVTAELLMGGLVASSAGLGVLQQQQQQQQQTKEEEQSATSSLPTAEVDGKEVPTTNDEVNVDDAEEYQNLLQTYKNVFNRTDENVDDWLVAQQQQQQQELIDDTDNDMSTADILVQEEVTDREERVKAFASTTDESASSKKDVVIQEDAIEAALVALAVAGAGAMVAEVGVATELAVGAAVALSAAFGAQQQSTKTSIDTETADKTERVENDVVAAVLEEQSDVEIKGMDARADPSTNQSSPQIADTTESSENKSDSQKQVEVSSDNQSKEEGPRKGQSSLIVDSQINEAADVTINDVAQTFSELNLPIAEEDEPPTKNRLDEQSEKVINGIEKGSIEVSIDESPNEIERQDIATPTKESGLQSSETSAPEGEALPNGVDLRNLDFVSSASMDKASTVVPSAQSGVPIENDVGNAKIEEDLQNVFEPPPEQIEESEIPLTQEEVPSQTINQNESFGQEDSPLPESVEQIHEQNDFNSLIEAQEQSIEELTTANQLLSKEINPVDDVETSNYTNGVAESDLVSNEEGSLETKTTTMGYEAPDSFAVDKNEAMAVADEYGEDRSIYREESELNADDESEEEAAIHCEEDKLTDDDEPEEESAINQKEEEILETLTPNMVLPPTDEKGIKPDDVIGDDPASQGKNEENSVRTLQPDMVLPPLSSFMDSSVKRIREQTRPLAETIVKSLQGASESTQQSATMSTTMTTVVPVVTESQNGETLIKTTVAPLEDDSNPGDALEMGGPDNEAMPMPPQEQFMMDSPPLTEPPLVDDLHDEIEAPEFPSALDEEQVETLAVANNKKSSKTRGSHLSPVVDNSTHGHSHDFRVFTPRPLKRHPFIFGPDWEADPVPLSIVLGMRIIGGPSSKDIEHQSTANSQISNGHASHSRMSTAFLRSSAEKQHALAGHNEANRNGRPQRMHFLLPPGQLPLGPQWSSEIHSKELLSVTSQKHIPEEANQI